MQGLFGVPVGNTAIGTELPTVAAVGARAKAELEELLFTPKRALTLSLLRGICSYRRSQTEVECQYSTSTIGADDACLRGLSALLTVTRLSERPWTRPLKNIGQMDS
jgi:hypothetical protein